MKLKGKALRRALATTDSGRLAGDVPLIQNKLELIGPEYAQDLLLRNKCNRPINWKEVERIADVMRRGEWLAHGQGILLDGDGNILTGQHRLWAVIYANLSVHMMVSRGNPPESARVIDRGRSQTARDLASRNTGRKHSPTEQSIVRAAWAAKGITDPTVDEVAALMEGASDRISRLLVSSRHIKKSRAVLMILGALCDSEPHQISDREGRIEQYADALTASLAPYPVEKLWNKGAAFGLAMNKAIEVLGLPMQPSAAGDRG